MKFNARKYLLIFAGVAIMNVLSGCATAGPGVKVQHTLEIRVDRSVGQVFKLRYSYGPELVNMEVPSAGSIAPFEIHGAYMEVPENFEITWETRDGVKHEAKVPVRSRLPSHLSGRIIGFVIKADHVEGYYGPAASIFERRERFY